MYFVDLTFQVVHVGRSNQDISVYMSFVHIVWCSLSLLQVLNFFLKQFIIIVVFELKAIAKHLGLYYQNICKKI